MKFEEIEKFIKEEDKGIEEVYFHTLFSARVEEKITKNGQWKITLSFNADELLKNPKSIPMSYKDMKLLPFLMFIKERPKY